MKRIGKVVTAILLVFGGLWAATVVQAAPGQVQEGRVTYVEDAHTLEITVGRKVRHVRLIGLPLLADYKPEQLAKLKQGEVEKYLRQEISGLPVYLEYDQKEMDSQGYDLAYVWLAPPVSGDAKDVRENLLNARLLRLGYGISETVLPNTKYAAILRRCAEEAERMKKGIWE